MTKNYVLHAEVNHQQKFQETTIVSATQITTTSFLISEETAGTEIFGDDSFHQMHDQIKEAT